jgi:hypothetical protein
MELASTGALDVGDGLENTAGRTAQQPPQTTQTVIGKITSEGSMPDSSGHSNIAVMDFAFDFDNEAVHSRIYTRVMASASVRNSIQYLSNSPALSRESPDPPLVASS